MESPAALPATLDHRNAMTADMKRSNLDFAAAFDDMTHAVVNALNSITAAAELAKLLLARDDKSAATRPLASIEGECMRAARLIRDGRDFMTYDAQPAHDSVEIAALLHACAEPFGASMHVSSGAGAGSTCVAGNARALRRLFAEIVQNAFQFGAKQLDVNVAVQDTGKVCVVLADDGPGLTISAARMFEPFFSTDPAEHSGLGLAIAARIAAAHGGTIALDATASGTAVRVELPRFNP